MIWIGFYASLTQNSTFNIPIKIGLVPGSSPSGSREIRSVDGVGEENLFVY